MIGDAIEVKLLDVKDHQVKIGIAAPRNVAVHRKEVYLAIQAENEQASHVPNGQDLSKLISG
jgi:carbon storage regulator